MTTGTTVRKRVRAGGSTGSSARQVEAFDAEQFVEHEVGEPAQFIQSLEVDDLIERYTGTRVTVDFEFADAPPAHPAYPMASNYSPYGQSQVVASSYDTSLRMETEEAYRQEYRLKLMSRMILRNADMRQIASAMDLTLPETYALRRELFGRMRKEVANIDLHVYVGKSLSTYAEIGGTVFRALDGLPADAHTHRARYIGLALLNESRKHAFMEKVGLFDTARITPKDDMNVEDDDMAIMREALSAFLDPAAHDAEIDRMMEAGDMPTHAPVKADDLYRIF